MITSICFCRFLRLFTLVVAGVVTGSCDTFTLPGLSGSKITEDELPSVSSGSSDVSERGMIDRKVEIGILKQKARRASTKDGGKILVSVHTDKKSKEIVCVRIVSGNEKLHYKDIGYYEQGELFYYVSEFKHVTKLEGYEKVSVISDEYEIFDGVAMNESSVMRELIKQGGELIKDETSQNGAPENPLSMGQILTLLESRIAFVHRKISEANFVAGETR